MSPPALILASTSPYRRALLQRLGLEFSAQAPGIEERHVPGEAPEARARRLASEKARAVATRAPEAVVIGSDQVAAAGAQVLDKPGDLAGARAQLSALAGQRAHFHTACAVVHRASGLEALHLDTTVVSVRALAPAEIERYLERERPFDCAGSFKVEALGIALFERIDSEDPTALIGLPLIWLAATLRRAGYALP